MPAIAQRYGVGRSAVQRHAKRHLSPALAAMQVEREQQDRATEEDELHDIIASLKRVLVAAEQEGKPTTVIASAANLGQQIERLAKLTGRWNEPPSVIVNYLSSPEILAALNVVYSELADHPDVRQRIAARLQPERLQIEAPR
ncbi:MAG TPA: hypothetical protein VIL79_06940 [Thermoleophilia bacterium]